MPNQSKAPQRQALTHHSHNNPLAFEEFSQLSVLVLRMVRDGSLAPSRQIRLVDLDWAVRRGSKPTYHVNRSVARRHDENINAQRCP